MPHVKLPTLDGVEYSGNIQQAFDNVVNGVERMRKMVEWLVNGNVNFQNIQANGITAKNISANSIETDSLVAGAVTADKISVEELSAISADVGHITAGLIESVTVLGSEIMTRSSGLYPRAQMSSTQNMFIAEASSNQHIKMMADVAGEVSLKFKNGSLDGEIRPFSSKFLFNTASGSGSMQLSSGGDLELYADILDSSALVLTNSWSRFYSDGDNESLQTAINRLQNQIDDLDDRVTALGG